MTLRKSTPPQQLDPAVSAAVGDDPVYDALAEKRRRVRNLTPGRRRKIERDASRTKMTFDWPPVLIEKLNHFSRLHGVPANQLSAFLITRALTSLADGSLDLYGHRKPSRVPRFDWFLDMDEVVDQLAEI